MEPEEDAVPGMRPHPDPWPEMPPLVKALSEAMGMKWEPFLPPEDGIIEISGPTDFTDILAVWPQKDKTLPQTLPSDFKRNGWWW